MKKILSHRLFQPAFPRKPNATAWRDRSTTNRVLNGVYRAVTILFLLNASIAAWTGTKGGSDQFDVRNLPVSDDTLGVLGRVRRPYGMAPAQFDDYIVACEAAKIAPPRIVQTIGNAPASAGFHKQDGVRHENGASFDYCAAIDIRSRDLTTAQKHAILAALGDHGWFGWYRDWGSNQHIHIVYAPYPMKRQLRNQFHDSMHDKTGLVGHRYYSFFQLSTAQKTKLRREFFKNNPING